MLQESVPRWAWQPVAVFLRSGAGNTANNSPRFCHAIRRRLLPNDLWPGSGVTRRPKPTPQKNGEVSSTRQEWKQMGIQTRAVPD